MNIKRHKTLILSAIVLIVTGIWINSRWNVWFGNPPEEAYTLSNQPQRILLTWGNHGELSRNICWQCDTVQREGHLLIAEAGSQDTLRLKAKSEIIKTRGGQAAFNHVSLNGLKPGATYTYQACNEGKKSAAYTFQMPPKDAREFSFTFMGDVQDSSKGLSRKIFSHIYQQYPDDPFLLFGGDLIERPIDKYWELVFNDLGEICHHTPVVAITGNHEYLKGFNRELDARFPAVFSYYEQSTYKGNRVFSLGYHNVRLFMMDTNVDCTQLIDQREWLENELKKCTEKWKIVVVHHPIYSNKGKWNNLPVHFAFQDLIEKYGVDLVLQGHEHVYARHASRNFKQEKETPLYVSSYCSPKNYRLYFSRPEDRIGTDDRFFQRIKVTGDSLIVSTYTASNSQLYDRVNLCKQKGKATHLHDYFEGAPEKVEVSPWFRKVKKTQQIKDYEKEINEWRKNQMNDKPNNLNNDEE